MFKRVEGAKQKSNDIPNISYDWHKLDYVLASSYKKEKTKKDSVLGPLKYQSSMGNLLTNREKTSCPPDL